MDRHERKEARPLSSESDISQGYSKGLAWKVEVVERESALLLMDFLLYPQPGHQEVAFGGFHLTLNS
jgi:hypothetical protein